MRLDRLGPPGRGRGCRPHDAEVAGGAVADLGLLISGPALTSNYHPLRARGVEWASVSADLRGSLATRGVAPKQQEGSPACFLSGISGGIPLSLGAWVPKNLARRNFGLLVSAGRCGSTGPGRPGGGAASGRPVQRRPAAASPDLGYLFSRPRLPPTITPCAPE